MGEARRFRLDVRVASGPGVVLAAALDLCRQCFEAPRTAVATVVTKIKPVEDRIGKIRSLLHEASRVHHALYRKTDGDDPDWASWYSDWLTNFTELPEILSKQPVRSELTYLLVRLEKDYAEQKPAQSWQDWYAERILGHFLQD